MTTLEHKGIEYWTETLSCSEMPVLSNVINVLNKLTGDDDAEFKQLAEVILKDPHLTTQILKLANCVQYNPSGNSISTISRAIVNLGFRKVRTMCISLMVVDSLLSKEPKKRLLLTMGKAFFAATQAKNIYAQLSDNVSEQEEVFIAALVYNLGEMVFWAYGGSPADTLDIALKDCIETSSKKLIEKELGTSFKSLSRELGKAWNLGLLLQSVLSSNGINAKGKLGLQARAVEFGDALSKLKDKDVEQRKALLLNISKFINSKIVDTVKLIKDCTDKADEVAANFGATEMPHLVPQSLKNDLLALDFKEDIPAVIEKPVQVLTADVNLQLTILRQLSNSSSSSMDMNTIFQTGLEGMHQGIGLERVVLAFFVKDNIQAKYVLGEYTEKWHEEFIFNTSEAAQNIFSATIKKVQPVWLDPTFTKSNKHLYTQSIRSLMGVREAFVGVLNVNKRKIALFYADRSTTGEALTKEQFESFEHFRKQTEVSLQAMAEKRRA